MKPRLHLLAMLLAVLSPAFVHAESEQEDTPLGESMEKMNGAFRKLKRQVADPKQNEASLSLVAKLRKACVDSSQYLPAKIATLPEKDRAAAKASYQERMKDLIDTVDELGAALKAGKNDEAVKVIEDLLLAESAGHKEFRPKKKED